MQTRRRSPEDQRKADNARAKRAALKALRRARLAVDKAGVKLSDWEGEFLESVEVRVNTYGRAFHDPEKGMPGSSLSMLQNVKLKEISARRRTANRARDSSGGSCSHLLRCHPRPSEARGRGPRWNEQYRCLVVPPGSPSLRAQPRAQPGMTAECGIRKKFSTSAPRTRRTVSASPRAACAFSNPPCRSWWGAFRGG